jgi:hypothetical protein
MGKTFSFLSAIPYKPLPEYDKYWEKRMGFTEPDVAFMRDGSIICLLRTEDGINIYSAPTYMCRSTDGGKTWTDPQFYDGFGVWPNLLTLKNGVTLVCYGRPGLFVRASSDPSGLDWDDRVTVIEPWPVTVAADGTSKQTQTTCAYAGIISLGDDKALLIYSHFYWPNPEGTLVKTILARTVQTKML